MKMLAHTVQGVGGVGGDGGLGGSEGGATGQTGQYLPLPVSESANLKSNNEGGAGRTSAMKAAVRMDMRQVARAQ